MPSAFEACLNQGIDVLNIFSWNEDNILNANYYNISPNGASGF